MDGLLNLAGDGVLAIANNVIDAGGVTSSPAIVREVIMPSGANLVPADKLTLEDSIGNPLTVNFSLVTTPMLPIPPTSPSPPEGTVFFQLTDTPETIAANVALAYQSFFTTKTVGDTVLFFGASDLSTLDPLSTIVDAFIGQKVIQNRLEIIVPNGNAIADGSQLTIRNSNGDTTFTFVLNTVSEGPGTVPYQPGEAATSIADKLFAQLPASMDPIKNLAGNGFIVLADDAFGAASAAWIDRCRGLSRSTSPPVPFRWRTIR